MQPLLMQLNICLRFGHRFGHRFRLTLSPECVVWGDPLHFDGLYLPQILQTLMVY